jgi:Putative zinc ribbon domain
MKKDEHGGGTHSDGSRSDEYCSRCYDGGEFRRPEMTVGEMQELVKQQLKRMGFPGFIAGFFTKRIPTLKRWRSQEA